MRACERCGTTPAHPSGLCAGCSKTHFLRRRKNVSEIIPKTFDGFLAMAVRDCIEGA